MTSYCVDCKTPMGWDDRRYQFGRAMDCGLTAEETKQIMPRCGRCVTAWMRDHGRQQQRRRRRVHYLAR